MSKKTNRVPLSSKDIPSSTLEERDAMISLLECEYSDEETVILAMRYKAKETVKWLLGKLKCDPNKEKSLSVWTTPDALGAFISIEVHEGCAVTERYELRIESVSTGLRYHHFIRAINSIVHKEGSAVSSTSVVPIYLEWNNI